MTSSNLQESLRTFAKHPSDPGANLALARSYLEAGQISSAATLFVRTAEISHNVDTEIAYESLVCAGGIFEELGPRVLLAQSMFWHALEFQPERLEAYFFLSRNLFYRKQFQESLTFSRIGITLGRQYDQNNFFRARMQVTGYFGSHCIELYLGRCLEELERTEESEEVFRKLIDQSDLDENCRKSANRSLQRLASIKSPGWGSNE